LQVVWKGLDEDLVAEFAADAEAGVADLANEIAVAADEFDRLLLAKSHFTEAKADILGTGEALDANDRAGLDAAERANERLGALAVAGDVRLHRFFHLGATYGS
jgi:hypothetical protein